MSDIDEAAIRARAEAVVQFARDWPDHYRVETSYARDVLAVLAILDAARRERDEARTKLAELQAPFSELEERQLVALIEGSPYPTDEQDPIVREGMQEFQLHEHGRFVLRRLYDERQNAIRELDEASAELVEDGETIRSLQFDLSAARLDRDALRAALEQAEAKYREERHGKRQWASMATDLVAAGRLLALTQPASYAKDEREGKLCPHGVFLALGCLVCSDLRRKFALDHASILALANADVEERCAEWRTALSDLVATLPECDYHEVGMPKCRQPATRAWNRGVERFCDEHGGPLHVPEYPRAAPLRRAIALLKERG
jgi:hypothetical protein